MSKQGEGCDRAQVCEKTGNSTRPVGRVRIQLNSNAELITGNRITGTAYDDVFENIITHTHPRTGRFRNRHTEIAMAAHKTRSERSAPERNVADVFARTLRGLCYTHTHTHCGRARGNQTKAVTWIYCIYNLRFVWTTTRMAYRMCTHAKCSHCSRSCSTQTHTRAYTTTKNVALMLASRTAYFKLIICVSLSVCV